MNRVPVGDREIERVEESEGERKRESRVLVGERKGDRGRRR
jgi:hypothetical protein